MRKLFTIILGIFALTCLTLFATRTMYVKHKTEGVIPFEIAAKDSLYFWNTVADKDADESGLMMYVQTANNGLKAIPYKQVDSIYFGKSETPIDDEKDYIKDGALIKAAFKVSDTKSVYFSQGNLQFNAQGTHKTAEGTAKGTWRFAESQWDVIGSGNMKIAEDYDGWIDLFGWGTSGWVNDVSANSPWSTSEDGSDYYLDGQSRLFEDAPLADWGVFNVIRNGGNEMTWRTLTADEWSYLFENNSWTLGYVETSDEQTMLCYLLIPEGFVAPSGINVSVLSELSNESDDEIAESSYVKNFYSIEQFEELEKMGVVALPCGGHRWGTTVEEVRSVGNYWSASGNSEEGIGYSFTFSSTSANPQSDSNLGEGLSVRLVRDVVYVNINFANSDGTVLLDTSVVKGVTPTYTGEVPTMQATEDYTFRFRGWNEEIVAADQNKVYYAVYDSFLTKKNGAIRAAAYKVSDSTSVYFSQGNLQFNAVQDSHKTVDGTAQGTWRFAENQYDIIGTSNKKISSTYDGWIDLFGFGTSGWKSQPWLTSTTSSDYDPRNEKTLGRDVVSSFPNVDWGVYNAISNGGNTPNSWRTLTNAEWKYLLSNNQWTFGKVEGSVCLMLIPENFIVPTGINVTILSEKSTDSKKISVPSENTYTAEQFKELENLGVVALPLAGYRTNTTVSMEGASYWSSTSLISSSAYRIAFTSNLAPSSSSALMNVGNSVRLVCELYNITFKNPDGTTLINTFAERGEIPSYAGEPTMASTEDYNFRFRGWDKEIVATESDMVYTAVYDSFLTKKNGAIRAVAFKVSDSRSVYFSQGNLQFNAAQGTHATADGGTAQGTWRFAENQWNVVGSGNTKIAEDYDGWIDLFGWGTSGWDSDAKAYYPWSTSETDSDYWPENSYVNDLIGDRANADWGVYNAISNGGNEPNKWRTLTMSEWQYLFKNNKWTLGYIKTTEKDSSLCYFLIPDGFTAPTGVKVTVISTSLSLSNGYVNVNDLSTSSYAGNSYTTEQFASLEKLGFVALPCGGDRNGTSVYDVGSSGLYWSSSAYDSSYAYEFCFGSSFVYSGYDDDRYGGRSVRLVQDL